MKSPETINAIARIAVESGLEPASLLAICDVESGGRVFAAINGKPEPLIRFEGHYFDRRLPEAKRKLARAQGLASPAAGAVANPRSQEGRWALLRKAETIDRRAARESVSWGLGQVMGAHWAWLGYGSVDELVAEARSGIVGQVRLMIRFIRKSGLEPAIAAKDWAAFARTYNGPGYKKHRYDAKIAAAYMRYSKIKPDLTANSDKRTALQRGSKGENVARLQRKLSALGYPLNADGDYGNRTLSAVRLFQERNGLAPTGIADAATIAAMDNAMPLKDGWRRALAWLAGLLQFISGRRRSSGTNMDTGRGA